MSKKLNEIQGIGDKYAETLKGCGCNTQEGSAGEVCLSCRS